MAKAKMTKNGNVQVTMSVHEANMLSGLLGRVGGSEGLHEVYAAFYHLDEVDTSLYYRRVQFDGREMIGIVGKPGVCRQLRWIELAFPIPVKPAGTGDVELRQVIARRFVDIRIGEANLAHLFRPAEIGGTLFGAALGFSGAPLFR